MTALALLLALSASDGSKPVVSVLYFENRGGGPELDVLRKGFAEMIITDLVAWDGVTVVERGRLEDVLKEQQLQGTKAFDKATAVNVGKLVGAQYAITGAMIVAGNELRVDASVTSVQNGEVVATASAKDTKDKVFDLEQKLMDSLTAAIDWKLKNRDARKKAQVPGFDALVAYSKAIDLSDQGKVDEAQEAMAAVVAKAPLFQMARERKKELLEKLKDFEARKKDLITASVLEIGRRADEQLKQKFGSLGLEQKKEYLFWREAKGRFLARALKQHLSWRGDRFRVVRAGQEAKALEVLKSWVENQRRYIEEAQALEKLKPHLSFNPERAPYWETVRDSMLFDSSSHVPLDADGIRSDLYELVIKGRLDDGVWFETAPAFGILVPAENDRVLASLAQDAADAEAAYKASKSKAAAEPALTRVLQQRAELLEWLRRDDEAAVAYQKLLDLLPTSRAAKEAAERIEEMLGGQHNSDHARHERYVQAVRDCENIITNREIDWRLRHLGLAGLDELAAEVEKACLGYPDLVTMWTGLYHDLAAEAALHEDCERAKRFHLKAFTFGSDVPEYFSDKPGREPWCSYGFSPQTLPPKVRVQHPSEFARENKTASALFPVLEELFAEELAARGVAVQFASRFGDGMFELEITLDPPDSTATDFPLRGKLKSPVRGAPPVELSAPMKGRIDFDAFFAPALKVLGSGSDRGPRAPMASVSLEQALAYGRALELFKSRKWKEAQAAFEALVKQYPGFRIAAVRARMAAVQAAKN